MGDKVTGITLQQIDAKIDHGPILAQQQEPILPTDTTPLLLHRLFTLGAQLFLDYLEGAEVLYNQNPNQPLIFTHKLTTESGHLEWAVFRKLQNHQPVFVEETANPLLKLRLTRNPQGNLLHDLTRALNGYEKVWTIAPTRKGELRLTIESVLPNLTIKLAGKPKPISYNDFVKYYLE
ncbi:MAG: Methionyl-tRNA formyltransferase, partial [Microgenomates group bacterium GW2011_GWE1_47_12]